MKIKIAPEYDPKYLEVDRPQPLTDSRIEQMIQDVLSGNLDKDITDSVYTNFEKEMTAWLLQSKLNTITGLDNFNRVDIVNGCTQFIDAEYMKGQPQFIVGDYKYHDRLGNWGTNPGSLKEGVPLMIAMPFPRTGNTHEKMREILDEAQDKGISVHVDGAWLTCCRGINFDLSHPSIKSVAISLSKGLGLGWNRIGLRWTRQIEPDSVTIMNDFNMNLRAPAMIGLHFIRNLEPDYLWNQYGDNYYKICKDFDLTPTNSIYLARKNDLPVGVSPLIRFLANV